MSPSVTVEADSTGVVGAGDECCADRGCRRWIEAATDDGRPAFGVGDSVTVDGDRGGPLVAAVELTDVVVPLTECVECESRCPSLPELDRRPTMVDECIGRGVGTHPVEVGAEEEHRARRVGVHLSAEPGEPQGP